MCDALASCRLLGLLRDLLGHGSCHQTSNNVSDDDPPHTSIRLGQSRQPSQSNVVDHLLWCVCHQQPTLKRLGRASPNQPLSRIGNKWSAVIPDGPGAASRRAVLKHTRKASPSNSNGSVGSERKLLSGERGRPSRFVKALRVAEFLVPRSHPPVLVELLIIRPTAPRIY